MILILGLASWSMAQAQTTAAPQDPLPGKNIKATTVELSPVSPGEGSVVSRTTLEDGTEVYHLGGGTLHPGTPATEASGSLPEGKEMNATTIDLRVEQNPTVLTISAPAVPLQTESESGK